MPGSYGWQIQIVMLVQNGYVSKHSRTQNYIFISFNKLNVQLMFVQVKDNSVQHTYQSLACETVINTENPFEEFLV